MRKDRMALLTFLNELFTVHRDLDENVSLCYSSRQNKLFFEDLRTGEQKEIEVPHYKDKPADFQSIYEEFFVEGTHKKSVECIFHHGMSFLPGEEEGSIIFGKEFLVVYWNEKIRKEIKVVNVDFNRPLPQNASDSAPARDKTKKKNGLWRFFFWVIVLAFLYWWIFC